MKRELLRNIAIIAHVDHGKTTLVNQMLKFAGAFKEYENTSGYSMDSNPIERERGITILAKTTGIDYKGIRVNILDTPGHADFGGEVERIMNMVDGCLLLVDAFEGTMPQTRFVLKKALEMKVRPIVVINKVDRPNSDISKVVDDVLELFLELGAPEEFLNFKVAYTSALKGTSSLDPDFKNQVDGMDAIFRLILNEIEPPKVDVEKPFLFQPALLDYSDYFKRIGIGVIKNGVINVGEQVTCMRLDGTKKQFKILKLFGFYGLRRIEIETAGAGEIVAIAGLEDINVGESICQNDSLVKLPTIRIDEPTLQMTFGTNTSPFAGKEKASKYLTARHVEERLMKEIEKDVSLRVDRVPNSESWIVSGRGELHLGILIENMRREGYELEVSKPEVIIKSINGIDHEPYEDLLIDIPNDFVGIIMETLGQRSAELVDMDTKDTTTRLSYIIPSRGLIGFASNFMTLTKGYGIIAHTYREYQPKKSNAVGEREAGVLVSTETGQATGYAIQHIEERGTLFITPGTDVYEGMIIGENRYDIDLAVNIVQAKHLTNMRSAGKDNTVVLKIPRRMTLEDCLDYINSDELVEITPSAFRMRKRVLNTNERKKNDSRKKYQENQE